MTFATTARLGRKGGYPESVLASSPLFYLRLNELSGTTATDSSSNSRSGTTSGATVGSTGIVPSLSDTSYDFDGSNDYVRIDEASWMDLSTFTVEISVNLDATSRFLVSRWATVSTFPGCWAMDTFGASGAVRFYLQNTSASSFVATGSVLSTATNYLLTGTFDGTNARIYVNGSLSGTSSSFSGTARNSNAWSDGSYTYNVELGTREGGNYPDGNAGHLAYFSGAHSGTVISDRYNLWAS